MVESGSSSSGGKWRSGRGGRGGFRGGRGRGRGGGGSRNRDRRRRAKKRPSPKHGAAEETSKNAKPRIDGASPPTAPQVVNPESRTSSTTRAAMGDAKFSALQVHQPIKRAIAEVLGYETMTKCQELSIPVAASGKDVLVKAKTGTGKTLAFLIPAIHSFASSGRRPGKIHTLIISPTRELASQIAAEGKQLISFLDCSLLVVYGGTNIKKDLSKLKNQIDILVATPGRLNDHLYNYGLDVAMNRLSCLCFDEADQLLEMGFRPDINRILAKIPAKETRQTLLFSATMPRDILEVSKLAMRSGDEMAFIDCVGEDQSTHQRVPQFVTVCNFNDTIVQLVHAVEEAKRIPDFKIICFFVTARLTQLHAELFNLMGIPVLEIHSRKSQSARTKVSKQFREGRSGILFTSDVTARGMDYPNVSTVIQVGMPSDKAQYIHRLGRTARAGAGGSGILLLADFERSFLNKCKDQPMVMREGVGAEEATSRRSQVFNAVRRLAPKTCITGYQAWLGYYNSNLKRVRWAKGDLVEHANAFATEVLGLHEPPALLAKTVGKMGLKNVRGLRVEGRNGVPRSDFGNSNGGNRRGNNNNRGDQGRQQQQGRFGGRW